MALLLQRPEPAAVPAPWRRRAVHVAEMVSVFCRAEAPTHPAALLSRVTPTSAWSRARV